MSEKIDYKKSAVSGFVWKFAEQLCTKLISFVISVILARLLMPEDYGVIALTSIFITICDIFVSYGFATSLIQKKDPDELDYSSVFYTSLVIALFLYGVLFISAPYIAAWFETPLLSDVLRVLGLRIPIGAFGSVQQAFTSKNLKFKSFFLATLVGSTISGVVGIAMAYNGFGVWALVAHDMVAIVINKFTLFIVTRWHPHLCYSWERTKQLFKFGWKILVCSLFETACDEANGFIIGKKYSPEDLAYTSKGGSMPKMVGGFIVNPIKFVLLPVLSSQQDKADISKSLSNIIKCCAYAIFPIMGGLLAVSPTLIPVLYTDKWISSVVFMQLMCVFYAFEPLIAINTILIQAKGRSDIYLIIGIVARSIGLALLVLALWHGVLWIIMAQVATCIIHFCLKAYQNKKLYGYGLFAQVKDILPYLILTALMIVSVYWLNFVNLHRYLILLLQVGIGGILYVGISILFRMSAFRYVWGIFKSMFLDKLLKKFMKKSAKE